jgi:hypothetical protein
MFTPDNALDIHAAWFSRANTTIDVQNQYIKQFDRSGEWADDPSPIVKGLVAAATRGITVRVQVREDSDSDDVTAYLNQFTNIEVRWMGNAVSSSDSSYLSNTHNKMAVIDSKVSLISSINFGDNAFLNNREAGMVVQSATVANYYLDFFNEDWDDGEIPPAVAPLSLDSMQTSTLETDAWASPTDIPRTNFTGIYNVSAYVNPDNADQHIFKYLESAKESIYVSMYTISRQDFVDVLVQLKQNNPTLDIQVLISRRRVGGSENTDTQASALELTANNIPVYNSTDGLNFYHNKYWIIDQKHTFIYSGNWSPRSVTPYEDDNSYTSGDPNRDMGIAVHDAPDIANWIKTEVWDKDVAVAEAYDLAVGIKQNSFDEAEVISGTVNVAGTISGLTGAVSYSFGSSSFTDVTLTGGSFSVPVDTTTLENGVTELTVKVVSMTATFTDSVSVTIANLDEGIGWRLLLTEVLPDPDALGDTEGEFFELTNSFGFDVLLSGWSVGDETSFYVFPEGTTIDSLSSMIFSRDKTIS